MVSWRLDRSLVTHGSSPAATASELRHTSPPTMHRPVRTVLVIRSPMPGTATRDGREHDADDEEDRHVLRRRLALVVHSGS